MDHLSQSRRSVQGGPDSYARQMAAYQEAGLARAASLGNRGPLRLDRDGMLDAAIVDAYRTHGFYIFEGVIDPQEVRELIAAANHVLERAPIAKGAKVDAMGRTAIGTEFDRPSFYLTKPLSDPHGGTSNLGGRHPVKMTELPAAADAPAEVVLQIYGMCQIMPAALRVYGHPQLLAVAAAINGDDFVPYTDAIFIKQPHLGAAVAWHQDGVTHWGSPDWDDGIHGFNFQVQLYPTTAANALWVVPGSHKLGKVDIRQLVDENGGSDLIPGAIPLVCEAGDVTVANRQILHGSFANSSPDMRMSITFGFHRRSAVLGQAPALSLAGGEIMDEARIDRRSAVLQVAIDARSQHYPHEQPFRYAPFAGRERDFRYTPENFERVIKNYNAYDLAI